MNHWISFLFFWDSFRHLGQSFFKLCSNFVTYNSIRFSSAIFKVVAVLYFHFENKKSVREVQCFSVPPPFSPSCLIVVGQFGELLGEESPDPVEESRGKKFPVPSDEDTEWVKHKSVSDSKQGQKWQNVCKSIQMWKSIQVFILVKVNFVVFSFDPYPIRHFTVLLQLLY